MANKSKGGKKSSPEIIKKATAKGSGKVRYQNVKKEARTGDVKIAKPVIEAKNTVRKAFGKKEMNAQQTKSVRRAEPNLAKQIDRETKVLKGVRTAKPSTSKIPTKRSSRGWSSLGGMRGGDLLDQTK